MKKSVKIGIFLSIILIILIYTWGDRFRKDNSGKFHEKTYYLENYGKSYGRLKDEYIKKDRNNIDQNNISSYELREMAKLLEDYDFYEHMIKEDKDNYSLINYYIDRGDYDRAEKLIDDLSTSKSNYSSWDKDKLSIYMNMVDIYLGKEDSQNMIKLYYEMLEDKDARGSFIIDLMEDEYLSKIIKGSKDEEVKKQLVDKRINNLIYFNDLRFVLDETGYDSEEINRAMEIANDRIVENKTSYNELKIFLYFYPKFETEKLVEMRKNIIITELGNDYIIRSLSTEGELKILDEDRADVPRFIKLDKNFEVHDFVMTNCDEIIVLGYDDGFIIKEYRGEKVVDTLVRDEIVINDRFIKSKSLNEELRVAGSYKNRDVYLDNRAVYEVIRFEDKGRLSDLILNKYRVVKTGNLELIEMQKVL